MGNQVKTQMLTCAFIFWSDLIIFFFWAHNKLLINAMQNAHSKTRKL